ncbi:armadillo-like helical protein [Stemphylium lycopersici]|uniref:Armadillo-like helical protein n=1 Tax=Stemphylium lycopersici TaxID=183478 RepID=A0A364N0G2_STELY|nr:armadillo-like helical protein [Stemphylium lycopersici]RAR08707.1 armadillo-like helical protein [Stemphylium lycopersici]
MSEQRNIVVLGASGAGLQATHYILKHILPALKAKKDAKYHVYTISPASHWYFRVASPRVAASTRRMASEKIMLDLHDGFKQYSQEDFTFIEAAATGLETSTRRVLYRSNKGHEDEFLSYHALIVATGSSTYHPAFSMSADAQSTLDSIGSTNEKVASAKKIVVVGGGPTAVEFAGEAAEHRNGKPGWFSKVDPKTEVTLITSGNQLLPGLRPAIAKAAEHKLNALGVKVIYNTRVTETSPTTDGRTSLTLKNGDRLETDLYVPAHGVQPNSSWIPDQLLNDKGYLITNSTLRVDEAGPRVYAFGDVASYSRNNFWDIIQGLPVLVTNLKRDLLSFNSMLPDQKPGGKDRTFKPDTRESMIIPIGSGGGVGAMMGWKVPSWFVWMLKGRDYMLGLSGLPSLTGDNVKNEWVRLLGGSSQKKKQAAPNNPQQRLARFRQRYNQVLQTWQKSANLANDREALGNIRRGFQALTAILSDESRSPAPHMCLQFAAAQQIYTAVSKIAATAHDEGTVRDAVAFYNALIDSEEEDFLENDVFAASLMNFIDRTIGTGSIGIGEDIEADIVELLFGIAAKIRLQPEILHVWFTTASADGEGRLPNQKTDFAGITQKEDFPLCYQLIDHVHHEGRIGDFARTGLLYIFESASRSMDLEQWIVNSDLPTLMATGLGALYSQMSRKLSILHPPHELPLILSLSDYADMQPNLQAENFFGADFQSHLLTFLSYLAFWQDVLEHCRSVDVRPVCTQLTSYRYPSLLESSDADGGSSVAVLTYLRHILDALDHPELVHMMLQYLLALLDYTASTTPRSPAAVKRRQSLMLLSATDKDDDKLNPSLFNLVDLVLGSTASRNPQTVIAALKLTTVIMSKSHGYALGSLVKVMNLHHKEHHRTVGSLNKELELYLNIAVDLAGLEGVDEAYDSYLKDVLSSLESHPCSLKTIGIPATSAKNQGYFDSAEASARDVDPHLLLPEDPLFQTLIDLLLRFLTNDVETNLALTEAIITLGTCSQLRLEGWLSVDPADYHFENDGVEAEAFTNDNLRGMFKAERLPSWSASATPQIFACLQQLRAQVDALRSDIKDWDEHVANRKHAFRFHQDMVEESKMSTPQTRPARAASETPVGSWTPQIPKHVLDQPKAPSRAQSPRGRKEALAGSRNTPTTSPAPSRYGGQTLVGSPARASSPLSVQNVSNPQPSLMSDVDASIAQIRMNQFGKRRIRFRRPAGSKEVEVMLSKFQPPPKESSDGATDGAEQTEEDDIREASLLHIITNVVILQNFVLELVALMQVRASLFNEVKFL